MSLAARSLAGLRSVKRRLRRSLRAVAGPRVTEDRIVADLRSLGVRPGSILLVHSSLSSLGYVPRGGDTVIRALERAIGPEGTLVLPTHSWEEMERRGGRVFDARLTESCVGRLTEVFRTMDGVVRSLHPSHSVAARGPLARTLTEGHEESPTPCGEHSPYDTILQQNGQILFLGADLSSNTAYHTIEALVHASYLLKPAPDEFTIIDANGNRLQRKVLRHAAGIPRRFRQWEGLLIENHVARTGRVGPARSILLEGRAFRDFMIDQVSQDPGMLLA